MRPVLLLLIPATLLVATGCGDDDAPAAVDGGDLPPTDGGAIEGGPAPPASPEATMLTPCPEGWREVGADPAVCEPWASDERPTCADDEAPVPGSGCATLGTACPTLDLPEDLPADREVVYVRGTEPPGGDGSAASPYQRIADALSSAPPGRIIALAKGTYDAIIRPRPGVTLWGACVSATSIGSSLSRNGGGLVESNVADAGLRNLRLGSTDRPGVNVSGGAGSSIHLEDVLIEDVWRFGVGIAEGASLTADGLVIRATRPAPDGSYGRAVMALGGSRLELRRSVFERNLQAAIYASGPGTTVTLSDSAILDTQPEASTGLFGRGVSVGYGSRVDLVRSVLEGNHDQQTYVAETGSHARLEQVVVRDSRSRTTDGSFGRGAAVREGASAEIIRSLFARNRSTAIVTADPGSQLTADHLVIRDTQSEEGDGYGGRAVAVFEGATGSVSHLVAERNRDVTLYAGDSSIFTLSDTIVRDGLPQMMDGLGGRGMSVETGAEAQLTRVLFERAADLALYTSGGSTVRAEDLTIVDTESDIDGTGGRGLNVQGGATVEVTRLLVERARDVGVYASREGSHVRLEDAVIRDLRGRALDDARGGGIILQDGGGLSAQRCLVERTRSVGVTVTDRGSSLELTDCSVLDVEGQQSDGLLGRGVVVQASARADLVRTTVTRTRGTGLFAYQDAVLTLTDVRVDETRQQRCATTTCPDTAQGNAVGAYDGARVQASGLTVHDSLLCGLHLALDGEMDVVGGSISGCAIGACVQVEGYDVERLGADVSYFDNGTNLQSVELPVPEPFDVIEDG